MISAYGLGNRTVKHLVYIYSRNREWSSAVAIHSNSKPTSTLTNTWDKWLVPTVCPWRQPLRIITLGKKINGEIWGSYGVIRPRSSVVKHSLYRILWDCSVHKRFVCSICKCHTIMTIVLLPWAWGNIFYKHTRFLSERIWEGAGFSTYETIWPEE